MTEVRQVVNSVTGKLTPRLCKSKFLHANNCQSMWAFNSEFISLKIIRSHFHEDGQIS